MTAAVGTTRRRPHFRLVLLYGYEIKDFFHGHINTQTILKFPDKLIGRRAPTTVPARTSAIQQQSCSSQEIQRIASLHLAETLRPTALPHGSVLHLYITSKLLLCVRLGMSRDRRCGHHAAETPLHAMHLT